MAERAQAGALPACLEPGKHREGADSLLAWHGHGDTLILYVRPLLAHDQQCCTSTIMLPYRSSWLIGVSVIIVAVDA